MRIMVLLSAFALAACATALGHRTVAEVEDSSFETFIRVSGVQYSLSGGGMFSTMHFRSWVDRETLVPRHQLYVHHSYTGDWRFWDRATDDQARRLDFTEISRDVGSCSGYGCRLNEAFGVSFTDADLRERAEGFRIQFAARTGNRLEVEITSEMIAEHLAVTDSIVQAHSGEGATR